MDAETKDLLRASLRHLLTSATGSLGDQLDELGWDDVLADDEGAAVQLLFEVKGETLASADALGPVLARALTRALGPQSPPSPTVVLPASLRPDRLTASLANDGFEVRGVLTGPAPDGSFVVPAIGREGEMGLAVFPTSSSVTATPIGAMDPDLGLLSLSGHIAETQLTWIVGERAASAWVAVVAAGRWAVGAELVGLGRYVIDEAVAYACDRQQYGRAIGSFQAVQHRLADGYAAVAGAAGVVDEAASSARPWDALVAKGLAGRAAEEACRQSQQAYGAIGFTWEHEFRRYLRRCYLLDGLFGDWRSIEEQVGAQLLATGEVPRIGAL